MNKKTLKVIGLVMFAAVLISICIMPVSVKAGGNGTCCPEQGSICVIGSVSHSDYYYLESGPCPLPK